MFAQIVQDLLATGWTEQQLAAAVGITQASINRIKRGKQSPGGALALALLELHRARCQPTEAA